MRIRKEDYHIWRDIDTNKVICPFCKKEIPYNKVQQGGLHVDCWGTEIDVWFTSIPDDPENGFYEKNIKKVMAMLQCQDEPFIINRERMYAGQFYNSPEFKGF